jgi:hypothetical protein
MRLGVLSHDRPDRPCLSDASARRPEIADEPKGRLAAELEEDDTDLPAFYGPILASKNGGFGIGYGQSLRLNSAGVN